LGADDFRVVLISADAIGFYLLKLIGRSAHFHYTPRWTLIHRDGLRGSLVALRVVATVLFIKTQTPPLAKGLFDFAFRASS